MNKNDLERLISAVEVDDWRFVHGDPQALLLEALKELQKYKDEDES